MRLLPQARSTPFGPVLRDELGRADLEAVDVAVAWVRASGLLHLQGDMSAALTRGASIRVAVGIDAENTSEEGLRGLLKLAASAPEGRMKVFVRHNEAGPIFHPKLYAFRSGAEIRAYIGSNNLTQSGLFQNDELSVRVKQSRAGQLEGDVERLMVRFTDLADPLNKALTDAFLSELVAAGYVKPEARLVATTRARSRLQRTRSPLFGYERRNAPKVAVPKTAPVQPEELAGPELPVRPDWHAVYLRVRLARGTQAQIPVGVIREIRRRMGMVPMDGPLTVRSRITGEDRGINPAYARGKLNTYKIEAREARGEPLLVIEPVGRRLFYQFLNASTPVGREAMQLLEDGFNTDPPQTHSTKKVVANATWFRFE